MSGQPTVFVSYARADSDFVNQLVNDLAAQGVRVWWDRALAPGQDWQAAIAEAIGNASVLLFVASASSATSVWTQRETEAAVGRGVRVIPLVIDEAGPSAIPPTLQQIQWVDFREGYQHALASLATALPKEPESSKPLLPAPQVSKGYAFLSYAEEDQDFVSDVLIPLLSGRHLSYWAYQHGDRRYDTTIARELEDRIINAAVFVAVLSPNWKAAEWTERELMFAEAVERPRLLVLASTMAPSILTVGKLVLDFTTDGDRAGTSLVDELTRYGL